jgi:hypothetical protein
VRICACCGDKISRKNAYGYCSRTPECRSRYQQAWQDARRPADAPPTQPCQNCGLPTTAKSGYCKRTKTCDAARHRAEYTPEKGFRKHKPDEPRRRCVNCGNYLDLRTHEAVALCGNCQVHPHVLVRRVAKAEAMLAYGDGCCACCGEDNLDFLTLDHINGDGSADRGRGRGGNGGSSLYVKLRTRRFPDKDRYQVLCFNCNCAKGTKRNCPCLFYRRSPRDFLAPGQLSLF